MPSWAYNIIVEVPWTQQQSSNDGFLIYDTHTRKEYLVFLVTPFLNWTEKVLDLDILGYFQTDIK